MITSEMIWMFGSLVALIGAIPAVIFWDVFVTERRKRS